MQLKLDQFWLSQMPLWLPGSTTNTSINRNQYVKLAPNGIYTVEDRSDWSYWFSL